MAALYDHFKNNSLKWAANESTPNGSPDGADGFSIDPVGSETFSINFRRAGSNAIRGLIDPDGNITDPGNTSTSPTASANASREEEVLYLIETSGNVCLVLEWEDAIMVLVEEDTGNIFSGYHVGRIFEPVSQDLVSQGVDGLGVLGGEPRSGTSGTSRWGYSGGGRRNAFRVNNTGVEANDWTGTNAPAFPSSVSTGAEQIQNVNYAPLPKYVNVDGRLIGVMKYWFLIDPPQTSKTRLRESGGEDLYMYLGTSDPGSTTQDIVAWPDGVDPNNP